jgi:HPr kinase/phosphorylase
MHGVLVEVLGEGILILGESGVGKSETALELVKRGHRLIADDLVEVRRVSDTTLLGKAPENIRYMLEIRGLGILDVKELYGVSSVKIQENINFVINLEFWDDNKVYKRIGIEDEHTDILGVSVPSVTIPVRPGRNLAIIVEFASINSRNQKMGHDVVKELTERIYDRP